MVITILYPEFIFAKGVCELRFALRTLHLISRKMESNPSSFESVSTYTPMMSDDFTVTSMWTADYGPWMRRLYRWLVLPIWPQIIGGNTAEEDDINDTPVRMSATSSMTQAENSQLLQNTPGETGIPMLERRPIKDTQATPQAWTLSHAYYANMGGLVALKCTTNPNENSSGFAVLRGDHIANWNWEERGLGHPLKKLHLSAEEIHDKSKADWLVKLFSMVQIGRLILDLINRAISHRPITQIAPGTAAFAVFAIITYTVNWWKPKDISFPRTLHVVVDERRSDEAIERSAEPFLNRFLSLMPRTLHFRKTASPGYRIRNYEQCMDGAYPVVWPLMAASCVVFGAFHCIAWNWQFPTDTERILWRATSVISTLSPLVPLAFTYFLIRRGTHALSHHQSEAAKEASKRLRPLQMLPNWIQLLQTNIDDQAWRGVFGEECYEETRKMIVAHAATLHELRNHLSALNKELEQSRHANLLENIWESLVQLRSTYESLDGGKGAVYEDRSSGLESHERWILKALYDRCRSFDTWTHRSQYKDSQKQLQRRIRRYSRPINIGFGIVYAISRIILIGIMFSSLRAVPKGVYEVANWTRYLPSFS